MKYCRGQKINKGFGQGASTGGADASACASTCLTEWGKLRYLSWPYVVSGGDKKEFGLSGISYSEVANYWKADKLVVELGDRFYIRKGNRVTGYLRRISFPVSYQH